MELIISEGCCYQVINRILNITTHQTASMLTKLFCSKGAVEVSREEAFERGFEELANWAVPESDRLYVIDDHILICLPKEGGPCA